MQRLCAAISAWKDCLTGAGQDSFTDQSMDTTQTQSKEFKLGGSPEMEVRVFVCVWSAYVS